MAMQEESHASGSIGADADADAGGLAICFDPFSIIESHPHMYGGMSYVCVCVCALMSFSICYPACVFHIQHVCRSAECAGVSCCSFDVCVCARLALVVEHYSCAYICSPI